MTTAPATHFTTNHVLFAVGAAIAIVPIIIIPAIDVSHIMLCFVYCFCWSLI